MVGYCITVGSLPPMDGMAHTSKQYTLNSLSLPWCSAFVNWCVEQAGFPGTDSAWARSWLKWGQEADWQALVPGSIVVLQRGANSGHVGFFVDADDERIQLLGGNQGDQVSEAWFSLNRVLGIRAPV